MTVYVFDGQGGGVGRGFIERLKATLPECNLVAVGSNAMATAAMLKSGANAGATGENSVVWCCKQAQAGDVIIGPLGIVLANSMLGEFTPVMTAAVSESRAHKILIPVSRCRATVAGVTEKTLSQYLDDAVLSVQDFIRHSSV